MEVGLRLWHHSHHYFEISFINIIDVNSPAGFAAISVRGDVLGDRKSEIRSRLAVLYHRNPRFQIETGDTVQNAQK